ncbi:MAG: tRNA (adenosine(37)-N6)-threonylcarbamoyltransferase complex transferase subunit TsaD [Candidatus Berkelbacteria bacterium]|nr:tRNA (adenosine(37)-N6)-threonylcarbamoyltransferase complex transferase subunit TsaD [Candidatus Berkelbacteria bacterium]
MRNKEIRILAIETSCDETAAAVISNCHSELVSESRSRNKFGMTVPVVLSNVISSSADLHAKTGGIVPEVASRAQMEAMVPVVDEALEKSNCKIDDITHVAVTNGPGLIGSLLVGFNAAKTIAYAKKLPFIPINHIEGHIYSAFSRENRIMNHELRIMNETHNSAFSVHNSFEFPILALTVSGGHTSLTVMRDHGVYETIGETIDDAAGEAFDKVAKLLDLGYPGGPIVSEFASKFRDRIKNNELGIMNGNHNSEFRTHNSIRFPRPLMDKPNFNFSFSGLKTAVLTEVMKNGADSEQRKQEICFAFEEAAVEVLCAKAVKAARQYRPKGIILAGGVAANRRLQEELKNRIDKYNDEVEEKYKLDFYMPGPGMAGDNAVMIGLAAYYHIIKDEKFELFGTTVDSNLAL